MIKIIIFVVLNINIVYNSQKYLINSPKVDLSHLSSVGIKQSAVGDNYTMKLIKLTQGKFAMVDDEDYEFINQWKWQFIENKNGDIYGFRRYWIAEEQSFYHALMHRVIMKLTDKLLVVDHKDHNGLNNQKSNLRICTKSQNNTYRKNVRGVSKYRGVSRHGKGWQSQLSKDWKKIYIGKFATEIEAAIAYNKKALELHGEFAKLNIIINQ